MKIGNKKIWIIVFCGLALVGFAKASESSKNGFFWIGNNTYDNKEEGDATIGMIKVSGSDFGIKIEKENQQGQSLSGSAWMGVGSLNDKVKDFSNQGDFPSLGWLRFNKGFPDFCGEGKDCRSASWQRKSGASNDSLEGYLTGWAKFEVGKNGDGGDYPETWLYFKAPSDSKNYKCNLADSSLLRGKDYYACTNDKGYLFGYAWSSDTKAKSIKDNSGFGWVNIPGISFNNCEENGICNLNCPYDPDCNNSFDPSINNPQDVIAEGSCNLIKTYPANSSSVEISTPVRYQINVIGGNDPEEVFYKCSETDLEQKSGSGRQVNYECKGYSAASTNYVASARYTYKDQDGNIKNKDCNNKISIVTKGVSGSCNCNIFIRKANTSGEEDNSWKQYLKLNKESEEVEAKVEAEGGGCSEGKPGWNVTNISKIDYFGKSAKFVLKEGVIDSSVFASIKSKDGDDIKCSSAEIEVKEVMNWR